MHHAALHFSVKTTGTAYEDMQSQNARLLVQLTEKDEAINQYMADRIRVGGAFGRDVAVLPRHQYNTCNLLICYG